MKENQQKYKEVIDGLLVSNARYYKMDELEIIHVLNILFRERIKRAKEKLRKA